MAALPKGVLDAALNMEDRAHDEALVNDIASRVSEQQQASMPAPQTPSWSLPSLDSLLGGGQQPEQPEQTGMGGAQTAQQQQQQPQAQGWQLPSLDVLLGRDPNAQPATTATRGAQNPLASASGTPAAMPSAGSATGGMAADGSQSDSGSVTQGPRTRINSALDVTPDEPVTSETVTRAAAAALTRAGLPADMAPYIAGIAINEGILQPGTIARDNWSVGGVKAPGSAGVVTVPTREVINGQSVMQTASFGTFNSMQEGMDALAEFVRDSPRFGPVAQQAAQTGDYSNLIAGFKERGYATDPNWVQQVNSIAAGLRAPRVQQAAPPADTMARIPLTAAPASSPAQAAAAPSPAATGVPPAPVAASPYPAASWEGLQADAQSAPLMMKGGDEYDPRQYDEGPREAVPNLPANLPAPALQTYLPGDGGVAPQAYEQPFNPDDGPREATPGSVGSQPLPQTPNPMSYGPIEQSDTEQGPAVPAPQTQLNRYVPSYAPQAAQVAPTMPSPAANAVQAGIDAGVEAYNDPFFQAAPQPPRWVKIVSDAMQAFGAESAKNVARSLGVTDDEWFNVFGYPISRVDVAGFAGGIAADPTTYVGADLADPLLTVAKGAVKDFAPAAVQNAGRAVGNAVREGADALGRGLQGVGREVAGGLLDLNPAMTPRMAEGGGIGRAMADTKPAAPIVIRPEGWEAASDDVFALTKPGRFYRGMTEDEFNATLGSGAGVRSRADYSVANEGTSFSHQAQDAESYANYGRDDPRKTGRPTYLIEIDGQDGLRLDRDGYYKAEGEIPADRITRIIRMEPENGAVVGREMPLPRMAGDAGPGIGRAMADAGGAAPVPSPNPAWQMAPDEWAAEMARVSPDGAMPDPQVDMAAYRQWYQLNANKPAGMTPTLQTAPFETDARLRPAIESSYLRPDDYRFVSGITVDTGGEMARDSRYLNAAGVGRPTIGTPRARHLAGGEIQFRPDILNDERVGRTITHEVGHSIQDNLPESLQERWLADIHPRLKDFEYGRYLENASERPPTTYGHESPMEDFAESFTEWRQAQAEGRAPNLGPLRQQFMQDVDAWLSGGRSLERGTMDGQRFEQPRLLSTAGASPGGVARDIWARAATDIGNSIGGGVAGAAYSVATGDEENLGRNTLAGMAGAPLLGRGMRRVGGALGTPGIGPNGRPSKPTVEVLQQELDFMRATIGRARAEGNTDLERRAIDRAWQLESELVDARNARKGLEPAITSDQGRRIESLPLDERSADDFAGLGRERVSPQDAADLGGPASVVPERFGRMNSVLPFDPGSAALGGLVGSQTEDEDGGQGDPLRTALGFLIAGVGGGMSPGARRALSDAMKKADALNSAGRADEAAAVVNRALHEAAGFDPRLSREPVLPGFEAPRGRADLPAISDAPNMPGNRMGNVPPSQLREPTFPGMEAPYVRQDIPNVSDAPNRERVLGDVPPSQLREPTLPGMEAPYVRQDIPDVSEAPNRGPVLGDVPPSAVNQGALPGMDPLRDAPAPGPVGSFEIPDSLNTPRLQSELSAAERRAENMQRRGLTTPSVWEWIKQAGYAGIYGPATAMSSTVGGATELLLGQPKEAARALVSGRPGSYGAQLRAQIQAMPEGLEGLGRILTGAGSEGAAAASGGSQGTANLSERVVNPVGHFVARMLERPGEILTEAPDAVFRPLFTAQGMQREAHAIASEAGLRGRQALDYANELMQAAQELRLNPNTAVASEAAHRIVDAGGKYADEVGYKGKPGGFGQWLGNLAKRDDAVGVAASFLMPFPAMAARMSEAAVNVTPGVGAVTGMLRGRPKFDVIYDQALGTALAGGVTYWAFNGGITGSGPSDPEKRQMMIDQGWQPNSTLVGGYYIPNRVFGRFQAMLDTAGEIHDALAYGKADSKPGDLAADLVKRGTKIATDQTGLSGLADLHDMLAQGFASQFPGWAARSATRYFPYAGVIRATAAGTDTAPRKPEKWADVGLGEAVMQQGALAVPGLRQQLPSTQDSLGREAPNPQQGLGAIIPRTTIVKDDPTIRVFQAAGVDIPRPSDSFSIRNMVPENQRPAGSPSSFSVALTPAEQRQWNTTRGQELIRQTGILQARAGWSAKPTALQQADLKLALQAANDKADAEMQKQLGARTVNERIRSGLQKKAS